MAIRAPDGANKFRYIYSTVTETSKQRQNHLGKAVDCLLHLALASAKKNGIHSGFYFTQPLIETEKQKNYTHWFGVQTLARPKYAKLIRH